ncbi:hypothetical protein J5491_00265 [Candidatus Saccharibacteria bacterium]|nr:hypothetical protein [Candidatus Saccharibacteria bacterium]
MPIESAKNRGYFKIKSAASAFNFDFKGKTVLDIGSSTGGFTQYALEHGAAKVIAVEKGTNQMVSPLRHDPRVELHEKTDIFDFGITDIPSSGRSERPSSRGSSLRPRSSCGCPSEGISVILADVSFISLTKVLAYAKKHLANRGTEFLVMVKPQFEANEAELNRGIVKNEKIRREILKRFEIWLKQNDFFIVDKHDNELKGKNGNKERFYLLKLAKTN